MRKSRIGSCPPSTKPNTRNGFNNKNRETRISTFLNRARSQTWKSFDLGLGDITTESMDDDDDDNNFGTVKSRGTSLAAVPSVPLFDRLWSAPRISKSSSSRGVQERSEQHSLPCKSLGSLPKIHAKVFGWNLIIYTSNRNILALALGYNIQANELNLLHKYLTTKVS